MIDKALFRLIGNDKKYIFYTVAVKVLGQLANIGITASLCWAISLLLQNADVISYVYPLIIVVFAIAVQYICSRSANILKDILGRKVKKDLRERVYKKILKLGAKNADDMNMAGITQLSVEGIEHLDLYYTVYLPQFFFAMIAPIILFIICVAIDYRVTLVLLACVPLIPISIILVSRYAKKIFAKYWGIYTSMGDKSLDSVQGLKELKIFKADQLRHKDMNENAEDFRRITMKVLIMQLASTTIMDMIAYGGAGLGIALAVSGVVNGASPVAALFLILVSVEFFLPLRAFGSAFHISMNGVSAGKKIITLLETRDSIWGDKIVESTDLKLDLVSFSYDESRKVLNNVTMNFPNYGMTAIVGESGCGKSTVANLLIGAIRPNEGNIFVGNTELSELSRQSYYENIAVVSYNTYIFNESVRSNFQIAKANVSDTEIWESLKQVNLDKFITENGGLDKIIAEDANNISGGQKQRLALAINLVANKKVYIFDEATSNIDIESEEIIINNIKKLSKTKNVILISHRLANVLIADNIYFMDSGEVKESGSHLQLMKNNNGYHKLFSTQMELEQGYKSIRKREIKKQEEIAV